MRISMFTDKDSSFTFKPEVPENKRGCPERTASVKNILKKLQLQGDTQVEPCNSVADFGHCRKLFGKIVTAAGIP